MLCNCKLTLSVIYPFSLNSSSSSLSSLFVFSSSTYSLSLSDTVSKNDADRVDEDTFADYFKTSTAFGMALANNQDYDAYLRQVFQSGTDMMLPKVKTDIGKHCFTSIEKLPYEFYVDGKAKCQDEHDENSAWMDVAKDGKGKVNQKAFVDHFMSTDFGAEVVENGNTDPYTEYLESLFQDGLSMMLPAAKDTLGNHCFGSVEHLANEFYMDYSGATGASDATIPNPLDTGMPATSYANDPAMMGTHASTVAPAVSDASGSSDATIPNPLDTVEAVDICADKHEDHWGTFLFYLSASWLLHAM